MPSPLKNPESVYDIIFNTVTVKDQKAVQETARKCKKLFKQKDSPADPNVLIQLEKVLRERQNEQTLAKHIDPSKQKNGPKTPDELKESLKKQREDYEYYIQHFLPALKAEITESKKLEKEKAKEIGRIISEIISKSSNKYSKIEEQPINSIKEEIPVSSTGMTENNVESPMTQDQTQQELESLTKEEVCASDSDSGMGSRELSATSTLSEESLNSTLSSTEEDNGLQPEDEGETKLAHLTKTRSTGPSGRRSPSKYNKKIEDQMQPEQAVKEELKLNSEKSGSTLPGKEELKLEEQRKEAVLSEQSAPDNNNNDKEVLSKKQPNNRNFRIALATGCALSAIGCLIAGVVTLGMVGAGLFAMSVVLAIAAAVTRYLTPPPSELTSTNLSRPVDDKELTACSHL